MPIIEVQNAVKSYRVGEVETRAVDGVSLTIEAGEFTALVGPSGSGKTTLLQLMGCLDKPNSGSIAIDGQDVTRLNANRRADLRRDVIGFIFQFFALVPVLDAYENVELPLTYRGMSSAERKKRVNAALEKVNMAHRAKHLPSQLSGGQQQRVAVARAIVGEPLILLADEPTGNLDSTNGEAVMELLRELHRGGATICMVTHDHRFAKHADRSIHLFDGRVVEEGQNEQ